MAKRVLLKISGEVLGGADGNGIDAKALKFLCEEIKTLVKKKFQVAIVVGGGNFWRFRDNADLKIPRSSSDAIGMMATIMNARLLKETLEGMGQKAHALAPHSTFYFAEPYVPARGSELLDRGEVVICGGGTGNPYFTTDSAAALRALELGCDLLLKATKVEGVFDRDPMKDKKAKFFKKISYDEVLKRELKIMDLTSIVLCKENKLPVTVFKLMQKGNMLKAAQGKSHGTLIN